VLKRPFRNALLLLGGEGVSRLVGFATTALLARRLGVDTFGQLGFATAVLAYGVSLSDFGLITTGTRRTAESQADPVPFARRVLGVRLVAGLLAAILIVGTALVVPRPNAVRTLIAAYAAVTVLQAVSLEWLFFGLERTGLVAAARSLTAAAYFGGCLLLVRGPSDVLAVPAAFAAATGIGAALIAISAAARLSSRVLMPSLAGWRDVLRASWPVGLAGFLTQAHVNCGLVFLGLLRPDHEVGLYASASKLVMVFLALDRVFYTVFLPVIARTLSSGRGRAGDVLLSAARIGLATGLPLFVAAVTLAPWALRLVMGTDYTAAASALRVLAIFLPLTMVNSAFGYAVVAGGRETTFLRNVAVSAMASIAASLLLTLAAGAVGAATALVVGEGLMLAMMVVSTRHLTKLPISARFASPLVAGVLMGAAMLLLARLPVLALAVGLVVYGTALLLTRGVTIAELTHARQQ
jgi:O-antigen/teichoic acid export membrane protein